MNFTKRILTYLTIVMICYSCSKNTNQEKHQNKRNNIVNVKDRVHEIKINDVLIGSTTRLFILDKFLIIADYKSISNQIHIFSISDFNYLKSCAPLGQGPNEITNMGHIGVDVSHRKFYVSDHGKQKIFSYDIDSVLSISNYVPTMKASMKSGMFPSEYYFINDNIAIARIIAPTGNSGYNEFLAKWNMQTGKIDSMKYKHPDIEKKRVVFAVSTNDNTYVECYTRHDLITICNFDGELKYNIYGPNWDKESNKTDHFCWVKYCGNKIIASYSGSDIYPKDYLPTKLIVFDKDGAYIETLEIGYNIVNFCYDESKNRLIFNFDDVIQFGYLDL